MADRRPPKPYLPPRSVRAAGFSGEHEVFKADRRSRVWRTSRDGQPAVVKRFEHDPRRQRAALLLGVHPAQRELVRNAWLSAAGIRVVTPIDAGVERCRPGRRAWLATPAVGRSLDHLLKAEGGRERDEAAVDAAARLAADLVAAGFSLKDLKPSNFLIDDDGEAWLIDVSNASRLRSRRTLRRMLGVMDRAMVRSRVRDDLRSRFAEQCRKRLGPYLA